MTVARNGRLAALHHQTVLVGIVEMGFCIVNHLPQLFLFCAKLLKLFRFGNHIRLGVEFIIPHIVNAQGHGQLCHVDVRRRTAAQLRIKNQVVVVVAERKLPIDALAIARIAKRALPVDGKHEAVLKPLHAIGVVFALAIRRMVDIRRTGFLAKQVGIAAVDGLIDIWMVHEMLHDVDFAAMRPVDGLVVLRQHPNGRPKTRSHIEFRPHFHPTEPKGLAVATPYASRQDRGRVLGQKVVDLTPKHEVAILKTIKRIVARHVNGPTRMAPPRFRPNGLVERSRIEFIVPHQGIAAMLLP